MSLKWREEEGKKTEGKKKKKGKGKKSDGKKKKNGKKNAEAEHEKAEDKRVEDKKEQQQEAPLRVTIALPIKEISGGDSEGRCKAETPTKATSDGGDDKLLSPPSQPDTPRSKRSPLIRSAGFSIKKDGNNSLPHLLGMLAFILFCSTSCGLRGGAPILVDTHLLPQIF